MASSTAQGPKLLYGVVKTRYFDKGLGSELPEAYRKFFREWKWTKPTAVHYIPKEGKWELNELTGQVKPIQDRPIPLIDVPESHEGIWGGEAVIKGFLKRQRLNRRVAHFWVPVLRRSVVHSVVLDEYMSMTVTERTINLIMESHGFDHYLLKTLACDLRSALALRIKRKILHELNAGCPRLEHDPAKQKYVLEEYGKYLEQYTSEELEWYGLTYGEAIKKLCALKRDANKIVPHKVEFRANLIEQLKNAQISAKSSENQDSDRAASTKLEESSWLSKMNPFSKKKET